MNFFARRGYEIVIVIAAFQAWLWWKDRSRRFMGMFFVMAGDATDFEDGLTSFTKSIGEAWL